VLLTFWSVPALDPPVSLHLIALIRCKWNACYFRSHAATLPHRRNWARVQGQRNRENRADRGSSEADLRTIEFAEDPREHAPIWRMCFSCRCRHGVPLIASWKWRMSRCCQLSNMIFSVPSGTSCPTASVPLRPTKPLCFLILFMTPVACTTSTNLVMRTPCTQKHPCRARPGTNTIVARIALIFGTFPPLSVSTS
jgi:hypothetical protein